MKKICYSLLWSLLCFTQLHAQVPTLVKDIKPATLIPPPNTQQGIPFGTLGSNVLYITQDPIYGYALYKSDGTVNGTRMVRKTGNPQIYTFWNLNSKAYFWAGLPGQNSDNLWETDGTYAGTKSVFNLAQLSTTGPTEHIVQVGNEIWFVTSQRQSLFRTNGTLGGTALVKNFVEPGFTREIVKVIPGSNGSAYIVVNRSSSPTTTGFELWKADATGINYLSPIFANPNVVDDNSLSNFGGMTIGTRLFLLFGSYSNGTLLGTYLFTNDGTAGGSVSLGTAGAHPFAQTFGRAGNNFVFGLHDSGTINSSDGISVTTLWSGIFNPIFKSLNTNTLLCVGLNPNFTSNSLIRTDGTVAGTSNFYTLPSVSNFAAFLEVTNGKALLYNRDGGTGFSSSFWRTDGTTAGTVALGINGSPQSILYEGTAAAVDALGRIYFQSQLNPLGTNDLVRADATLTTITSVAGDRAGYNRDANPSTPIPLAGRLYFQANNGSGQANWRSDGTAGGTTLYNNVAPAKPENVDVFQSDWVFSGPTGLYRQTATGNPVLQGTFTNPGEVETVGNTVYFTTNNLASVNTLNKTTNLTTATPISVVPAGWELQNINGLTKSGSSLYFFTQERLVQFPQFFGRYGLYRYDGNNVIVIDYYVNSGLIPNTPVMLGNDLYFTDGQAIYKTGNGSDLVTKIFETPSNPSGIKNLKIIGNMIVFSYAATNTSEQELWKTDGTTGGTALVKTFATATIGSCFGPITVLNGVGYFISDNCNRTYALWKTDGTPAGTVKVTDLTEYLAINNPTLVALNNTLYFVGDDYPAGNELWKFTPTTNACSPDVTPPVIVACPANISVSTAGTSAPATWTPPSATDNCTAATLTASHQPGATFPLGATTVTYTARDAANNSATCSFVVTVAQTGGAGVDLEVTSTATNLAPKQWGSTQVKLTVKNNGTSTATSVKIGTGVCVNGVISAFGQATGIVYAGTPGAPTAGTFNFVTQEWTLNNLAGGQTAMLTLPLFCLTNNVLVIAAQVVTQSPSDTDSSPSGNNNLANCTAAQDDETIVNLNGGSGNPCQNDAVPPMIAGCPANISQQISAAPAVITWTAPTASDNCGTPSLSSTHQPGSSFPLGITTVIYTAKDAANNTATCSFTISLTLQGQSGCVGNVLANAGFESGLQSWEGTGGVAATGGVSGNALKMCVPSNVMRQTKAAQAGLIYTLKVSAKKDGAATGVIGIKFLSSSWTPLLQEYVGITSPTYSLINILKTAPSGTAWVEVSLVRDAGTGCLWADDFCLTTAPLLTAGTDRLNPIDVGYLARRTEELTIFPNPTGDVMNIFSKNNIGKTMHLTMFNQLGVAIFQKDKAIEHELESIDLTSVSNGSYFLKIEIDGTRPIFKKLIVSRMY